jgi:cell wall assembly regulator SMI1
LQDLIRCADAWLRTSRPDYYAILRPGVEDAALDAYEMRLGLVLQSAFRQLCRWRDGQDLGVSKALLDNHMFVPLSESAACKEILDGMIGYDFEDPAWWRRGWVPFTESYGGDQDCIDLEAADGQPGWVISFWHDDATRHVRASSLADWFRDLVVTIEEGRLRLA